ncbi:hypothetical protein SF23_03005 [Streptomyces sp. MBRL 10]|nr:hypothetical protein SF23_03005 [Streptomyces sp. MBRL 10]
MLYRTVGRWRYAMYFTEPLGVADGALHDPVPSSEPGIAHAACRRKVEELTHRRLEVLGRASGQPGC